MLSNTEAIATVGVRDLAKAKEFYGNVLGLQDNSGSDQPEVLVYLSGSSKVFVYQSEFGGSNKATAVTWDVGDEIKEIVTTLKGKGVNFEHYQMDGLRLDGDIHVGDGMKVAWLKDPDGNILSLVGI